MKQYRKSPRADFLSYQQGTFFITICTFNRIHYFGNILDSKMYFTELGEYVENQLTHANSFCSYIDVLSHVVMPNHIHSIIKVSMDSSLIGYNESLHQRHPNPYLRENPCFERIAPALSRYINSFKGSVTKYANNIGIKRVWQSRYHDRLIRNKTELTKISDYILNNVEKWQSDCFLMDRSKILKTDNNN